MATKEKLYEAFGELLYAVAKADGTVQNEEKKVLEQALEGHPWASDIIWSFNYEEKKAHPVKFAYAKALDIFRENGPFEEYYKFVQVLEKVASAFGGIDPAEKEMINGFSTDLQNAFMNNPEIR